MNECATLSCSVMAICIYNHIKFKLKVEICYVEIICHYLSCSVESSLCIEIICHVQLKVIKLTVPSVFAKTSFSYWTFGPVHIDPEE